MSHGFLFLALLTLMLSLIVIQSVQASADSWETKQPMPTPRSSLGVAVVNGKIYAMGGFPDLNTTEEYDPATDTWTTKAAMPTPRFNFAVATYENRIYCIGGMTAKRQGYGANYTGAIEVYDPATDTWESKSPMPIPRMQLEANVVSGKIYLIGGRTGGQYSTVTLNEIYDPVSESWTTKSPMQFPVIQYASAVVGNKIYVFGGQDEFAKPMNLAVNQIYDTATDTWDLGVPIPNAVWLSAADATAGVLGPERIYLIGGQPVDSGGNTNIVQVYNPETDSWNTAAPMPTGRFEHALAVVNDRFYAIGGTTHYITPNEEAKVAENEMYTPIGFGASQATTSPSPSTLPTALPTSPSPSTSQTPSPSESPTASHTPTPTPTLAPSSSPSISQQPPTSRQEIQTPIFNIETLVVIAVAASAIVVAAALLALLKRSKGKT